MWIFTVDGFFSVIVDRTGELLMVRARCREDLERLQLQLLALPGFQEAATAEILVTPANDYRWRVFLEAATAEILVTPANDYRWRVFLPREAWAAYLVAATGRISQAPVKTQLQLETGHGHDRGNFLWATWQAGQRFQEVQEFDLEDLDDDLQEALADDDELHGQFSAAQDGDFDNPETWRGLEGQRWDNEEADRQEAEPDVPWEDRGDTNVPFERLGPDPETWEG